MVVKMTDKTSHLILALACILIGLVFYVLTIIRLSASAYDVLMTLANILLAGGVGWLAHLYSGSGDDENWPN